MDTIEMNRKNKLGNMTNTNKLLKQYKWWSTKISIREDVAFAVYVKKRTRFDSSGWWKRKCQAEGTAQRKGQECRVSAVFISRKLFSFAKPWSSRRKGSDYNSELGHIMVGLKNHGEIYTFNMKTRQIIQGVCLLESIVSLIDLIQQSTGGMDTNKIWFLLSRRILFHEAEKKTNTQHVM